MRFDSPVLSDEGSDQSPDPRIDATGHEVLASL